VTAVLDRLEPITVGSPSRSHARRDPTPPAGPASLAARVGWTLVAVIIGLTAIQAWVGSDTVPGANLVSVLLILGSLLATWRIWTRTDGLAWWEELGLLVGPMIVISFFAAQVWIAQPSYGTDAVAFNQYAGSLVLRGLNPYTHSMAPALTQFRVPANFYTYRLDGTAVTSLSYPAGSFLFYLPLLALGIHVQAANIVDLIFWFACGLVLWRMLPRETRWAAGLVMSAIVYLSFVIGGETSSIYLPFVLLAVWRWDRYGKVAERSAARWIGPLAFGIAASVKQTPWFLAPFLLIGVYQETRRDGRNPFPVVARYVGVAVGSFLAINLPFIIANAGAWARGSLVPLLSPTIPDGNGLINLTIFERHGGGHLELFTVAALSFILLTLLAFGFRYEALKRAWVPMVALAFFIPTRSFGTYLFMLVPAALVAGMSVRPAALGSRGGRLGLWPKVALGTAAAVAIGAAVWALTAPAPLSIKIIGTRSTGQLQSLDEIDVQVTNHTGATQRPHFTVNNAEHTTTFWYSLGDDGGDAVLAPHATEVFHLHAPNTASMPGIESPLFVEAFTLSPATMSTSSRYLVSSLSAQLIPDSVNHPVAVGVPVTFTVQLENRYGSAISRAGVAVTLGQVIYGQNALIPAESSINGEPEGTTPVTALTNAAGLATFNVVGVQAQDEPVMYEAWLGGSGAVPHGYSDMVSVQYVAAGDGV
jgi:uncharacterized membrane protein